MYFLACTEVVGHPQRSNNFSRCFAQTQCWSYSKHIESMAECLRLQSFANWASMDQVRVQMLPWVFPQTGLAQWGSHFVSMLDSWFTQKFCLRWSPIVVSHGFLFPPMLDSWFTEKKYLPVVSHCGLPLWSWFTVRRTFLCPCGLPLRSPIVVSHCGLSKQPSLGSTYGIFIYWGFDHPSDFQWQHYKKE